MRHETWRGDPDDLILWQHSLADWLRMPYKADRQHFHEGAYAQCVRYCWFYSGRRDFIIRSEKGQVSEA